MAATSTPPYIPTEISQAFAISPNATIDVISVGNINATYKISQAGTAYILQSLNQAVFTHPAAAAIDANLHQISTHLTTTAPDYLFPAPLPASTGDSLVYDRTGTPWRLLPYIEATDTYNVPPTAEHAYQAALAFATFTHLLRDLPAADLQVTIPDFHNVTRYERDLDQTLQHAPADRLEAARAVIAGVAAFAYLGEQYRASIKSQVCTTRIHHHDTKINNLLFHHDQPTVKAIIDLDIIMPGYFFSDLGDLLMFGTSVFEDETDLDKIVVDTDRYDAILAGYQAGLGNTLSTEERALMPLAGPIMCYMVCVRFLTDYLAGEVYFKTQYPGQNLDKARNRLKLLEELTQLTT